MQNQTKIVAIDPGASGGIAHFDGKTSDAVPMLDKEEEICALLRWYSENGYKVYMEKVGGFIPDKDGEGQPGSRMFVFGEGYGFIRGVLSACGNPPVLVVPQRWQRGFPKFKEKRDRKNAFKAFAARVFPHLTVTLATADALCLLHYAKAQESGRFPVPAKKPAKPALPRGRVPSAPSCGDGGFYCLRPGCDVGGCAEHRASLENETIVPRRTKPNKPLLPAKVGTWTP